MSASGRDRHRDREPGRSYEVGDKPDPHRLFKMTNDERQQVARSLRFIDEARRALEAQQNPLNREIVRELQASADRIFDIVNGLEDI